MTLVHFYECNACARIWFDSWHKARRVGWRQRRNVGGWDVAHFCSDQREADGPDH